MKKFLVILGAITIFSLSAHDELFFAVERDDVARVKRLIDEGKSDVNEVGEWGATALHRAKIEAIVRLLINAGASMVAEDKDGMQPIHSAALANREVVVKALLDAGIDPDAACGQRNLYYKNKRPLHLCSSLFVAQLLLDRGASIDPRDAYEDTPLHKAVARDDEAMIVFLRRHGASLDATNCFGWHMWSHAKYNGSKRAVEALFANISSDDEGWW